MAGARDVQPLMEDPRRVRLRMRCKGITEPPGDTALRGLAFEATARTTVGGQFTTDDVVAAGLLLTLPEPAARRFAVGQVIEVHLFSG